METFIWHERDICCSSAVCESPAASCCQYVCVCVCVHFHVSLLWYSWCQCDVSSVDNIGASWKAHFLSSFLHCRVTVRPKPTIDDVAILKCQFVRCAAIQWSSSTLPNALLMNYDGTPFLHLLWCHAKQNQQTRAKPHSYKWSSSYLLSFMNACWLLSVASSTWETHPFKYDRWSR